MVEGSGRLEIAPGRPAGGPEPGCTPELKPKTSDLKPKTAELQPKTAELKHVAVVLKPKPAELKPKAAELKPKTRRCVACCVTFRVALRCALRFCVALRCVAGVRFALRGGLRCGLCFALPCPLARVLGRVMASALR